MSEPTTQDIWLGIHRKIQNAEFHLEQMGKALEPPERTRSTIVRTKNWDRPFYAHLDAFLSAARSIPELIQCCFGIDNHPKMTGWVKGLDKDEQDRRGLFKSQFDNDCGKFRDHLLTTARHISEHRTGFPPVTVRVSRRFGVTYRGGPTKFIPTTETPELPPEDSWMAQPTPVQPRATDFDIDGEPLFETCRGYLELAKELVVKACALTKEVHGDSKLTPPPSNM